MELSPSTMGVLDTKLRSSGWTQALLAIEPCHQIQDEDNFLPHLYANENGIC